MTDILTFASDVPLRRQLDPQTFTHPAKCHLGLLGWIVARYTKPGDTIGDPMAGVGSLLAVAPERNLILRDVEPRWLDIAGRNAERMRMFGGTVDIAQADARKPWDWRAKHIIFSPPYGCEATRGGAKRGLLSPRTRALVEAGQLGGDWVRLARSTDSGQGASYLFWYGANEGQIGHMTGGRYWQAMTDIYRNAYEALRGGYMVLVIKDHIRDGRRVQTSDETVKLCESLGFELVERHARLVYPLSLWQRLRKERGEPVVETEDVLTFRRRRGA